MSLSWAPREPPLEPVGLLAEGPQREVVLRRLLEGGEAVCSEVRGVHSEALLVLLGDTLPWFDGVTWLGRDPDWPGLYLPTRLRPRAPLDLLWGRLRRELQGPPPVLLLPDGRLVALGAARPVDVGVVAAVLGEGGEE